MESLLEKTEECIKSNRFSSKNKVFCLQLMKQCLRLNVAEFNVKLFTKKSLITALYTVALKGSERDDPLRRRLFEFSERNFGLLSKRMGA